MATSGVSSWTLKRDGIINSALRKLSVLSGGSAAQTWEISNATEALNAMLKGFQVDGMPIWAMAEYTFNTATNTGTYNIGTGLTLNTSAPLKVVQGYRVESTGASNIPLNVYNHYDYNLLPINATNGKPVNLFYQPFSTYGTIKLWPTPMDATTTITIVYQRPFQDMISATDDIDFPSYWTEAVIYGLAWRLCGEYGVPIMDRQNLQKEAEFFHQQAMSFGTEEGSMFFQPDSSGRK
jgi:hypothetical protein